MLASLVEAAWALRKDDRGKATKGRRWSPDAYPENALCGQMQIYVPASPRHYLYK
jgi:hypothetical protein